MPAPTRFPLLIEQQNDLDALCAELAAHDRVALDTEFVRTNTYAPQIGLLQLATNGLAVCVDPLANLDMQYIWTLLFDRQRTSIVHSAKQDLELLWFSRGDIIHNLVDTQICAGLLGYPAQIGYAGLLKELLSIEIGKTETRTDWTRRPLTEQQLKYAAEDVVHLPELFGILSTRLQEQGRYAWAVEDSLALCDVSLYQPVPDDAWQKIKSIPFLPPAQQARAVRLASWRESRAVEANKPRQWIISDAAILQLASSSPANIRELEKIADLPPALARKYGSGLLEILNAADNAFADDNTRFTQQAVDISREKVLSKRLLERVAAIAKALGIVPEILASRRDINALLRNPATSRVTQGWRRVIIGEALLADLSD
jgi:ribonuclease D